MSLLRLIWQGRASAAVATLRCGIGLIIAAVIYVAGWSDSAFAAGFIIAAHVSCCWVYDVKEAIYVLDLASERLDLQRQLDESRAETRHWFAEAMGLAGLQDDGRAA